MSKNKVLTKSTLQITFLSLISIIFSFVLQMIVAYYFGTEFERDAYFVAIVIPTYISSIFIGSFGVIFLPKVIEVLNKEDKQSLSEFISLSFLLLTLILLLVIFVCIIFSNEIISFFAQGYNSDQIIFTSKLLKIVVPTVVFSVLSSLMGALFQIEHKFIRPALVPIISSVVSVLFVIIFSNKIGILGLAYGFLLGSFISFIFLFPIIKEYNLKVKINLRNIHITTFLKTVIPLFLTGILFRSTGVIERVIASSLPEGNISYLGYSNQLLMAFLAITVSGISVTSFPVLSKLWTEGKKEEIEMFFAENLRLILLISAPIIISVIVFGDLFVKIIFERGAFTQLSTLAVSEALSWFMGAFLFQGLGAMVMKVFYLSGKTITVSIISIIELCIYFLLSFFLSKYYGFIGLAMALSFSSFIAVFLALFFINKSLIKIKFLLLLLDFSKSIILSGIGVLVVYMGYYYILGIESILSLIVCCFFGAVVSFFTGIYLGIKEVLYLKEKLIGFIGKFNF